MEITMETIISLIQKELCGAFKKAGYNEKYAKAALSNRPDLCQYQCNGALAAAKEYHKAPIQMAGEVAEILKESKSFKEISAIKPGFINITLSESFLSEYIDKMAASEAFGCEKADKPETIVIDYGGANVAKPLHVGRFFCNANNTPGIVPEEPAVGVAQINPMAALTSFVAIEFSIA